ncbi:hypothetical protein E9993_15540 [Labilibacter sediminis]|nr:hypothetical protein E9993_15540 [Labilibacter sediminis]
MLKRFITFLVLLGSLAPVIIASDLPQSRTNSYYKYIYKLTPKEAKSIYRKGLADVNESYFHSLTDSVPNDSVFNSKLPQGNYLLVWAQQNQLKFEMRSYADIDVMIHNNYADLLLTISDSAGMVVKNAKVKIDGTLVKYNDEVEAYRSAKKNKRGWLEVTYNDFTSYHYLGNNVKKGVKFRKVAFSVPVKYVYIPLRLLVFLPYDVIMSVYRLRPQGLPYYVYKPFKDAYNSIFRYGSYGWVNGLVNTWENTFYKDYEGYMVFSQPKYKPDDTVRFKAFILRPNGKPIAHQPLDAFIRVDKKNVKLKEIIPDNRGAYACEFVLHDSLQLKLDKNYRISLKKGGWNTVISRTFKYEDYELNSVDYKMRIDKNTQLKGKPFFVYLKGEDMNGLNVPDGRVKLTLKSRNNFTNLYVNRAYIPDTILTIEKPLDPLGETIIEIPDSIFPEIDFSYDLKAVFLTSDNERIQKQKLVHYYHNKKELSLNLRNDSVWFSYKELDVDKQVKAVVEGYDKNGNKLSSQHIELPHGLFVDKQIAAYKVKTAGVSRNFKLSEYTPSLSLSSNRNHNKLELAVSNPGGIYFNFFVYKKDKEIMHGYTQHLDTLIHMGSGKACSVCLNYEWAGKSYQQSYDIPIYKKQLHVELDQPQVIYPGQTADITVKVTDYKNRPVKGVDLTAYGLSKKFKYSAPMLDYYGKSMKARTMFNNYTMMGDIHYGKSYQKSLDYTNWNSIMSLDTITYYQFTRPDIGVHKEEINTKDNVTQFAPYVFVNGVPQQIHFIFLDYKLLYSSLSTTKDPFSFWAGAGYHKLRLRTTKQDITIDSVYFSYGKKNLISIDPTKDNKQVLISKRTSKLTLEEKRLIRTRFARFINPNTSGLYYLRQGNIRYLLQDQSSVGNYYRSHRSNGELIAGPFNTSTVNYIGVNRYSTDFKFEPSYLYTVDERLVKMKTFDRFWPFYHLSDNHILQNYTDQVLTQKEIERRSKQVTRQRISQHIQYNNPYSTQRGNGTIAFEFKGNNKSCTSLSNVIIFKDDDPLFMRIYPPGTRRIYDLKAGNYRLFFSMDDGSYFQEEAIEVKANNICACRVVEPVFLLKDDTSERITSLIQSKWLKKDGYSSIATQRYYAEKEIRSTYQRSQLDYTNSRVIEGRVVDESDEMGLPGVNVMIKGTDIGTISDIDGYYSIELPEGEWELQYFFIGFKPVYVPVSYSEEINVALAADVTGLDEVVVVGYGTTRSSSLTGSVSTVTSQALQGRMAGVNVVHSGAPDIKIRGVSSLQESNKPLIIVDGVPVDIDMSNIDKSLITEINILKDASATAIYGSRGANGVVIISTKSGKGIPGAKQLNDIEVPYQSISTHTLRSNFSDMAYWQPNLVTDKNGEASFTTTFPDDITAWKTFALAVGKNKSTGQVQAEVKAFKPVSAQLYTPRFLTQGDSITIIGKSINYLEDSIEITGHYQVDSIKEDNWYSTIGRIKVDSLSLQAEGTDTLSVTYSLERDNGYFDGENRKVPVVPAGVLETQGQFFTMSSDTLISFVMPKNATNGLLYLESNPLNILLDETRHLRKYSHLCNEQASSKLLGLLNEEKICAYLDKEFKYKKDVNTLIQRLQKSTNDKGVWGWWSGLNTEWWITAHVVEALESARQAGYKVSYDKEKVKYVLSNQMFLVNDKMKMDIVRTLQVMKAEVDYPSLIKEISSYSLKRIDSLKLTLIKQKANMPVDLSLFIQSKQETLYGNYYWGKPSWSLFYGEIQETLLMYEILKNDGSYKEWLPKIRQYFYERRSNNKWRNTYESTLIVNHLLPDLLSKNKGEEKCKLQLDCNGEMIDVDKFPYSMELKPSDHVSLHKKGDQVVFAGWHNKFFNDKPRAKEEYFKLRTYFKRQGEEINSLTAGEKVSLLVDIDVKKKSDYVLLEIPIPSVCSYHQKSMRKYNEAHREYHKEKVCIYYKSLKTGKHRVEIELVPRYTGQVILNPARMEHMYFPVFYGNNEMKEVEVGM